MLSLTVKINGTERIPSNVTRIFLSDNGVEAIKMPQLTEEEVTQKREELRPLILSGNSERNRVYRWLESPVYEEITEGELNMLASEFLNAFREKQLNVKINGEWYEMKAYKNSFQSMVGGGEYTQESYQGLVYYKLRDNNLLVSLPIQQETSLMDLDNWFVFHNEEGLKHCIDEYLANRFNAMSFAEASSNHAPIEVLLQKRIQRNTNLDYLVNAYEAKGSELRPLVEKILNVKMNILQYSNIQKLLKFSSYPEVSFKLTQGAEEVEVRWDGETCHCERQFCPHCGNITTTLYVDGDGTQFCPSCYSRITRVKGYHSTREFFNPMRRGTGKASDRSLYGCEIEMIKKNNHSESSFFESDIAKFCFENENRAKFEHDGSLGYRGEEMITQPLSKAWILSNMRDWLTALNTLYCVDSNCGLHIHVDKSVLNEEQWNRVFRFLGSNHRSLSAKDVIRRSKNYCNYSRIDEAVRDSNPCRHQRYNDHSNPINFLGNHGHAEGKTVEFRFFDGTLDPDKWMKNISFVFQILDLAESGELPETTIKIKEV